MRKLNRHTMGQDWGGRRKANPENCPKVTHQMVLDLAKEKGIEVKRGDFFGYDRHFVGSDKAMWWAMFPNGEWRTIGMTNYLAWDFINSGEVK